MTQEQIVFELKKLTKQRAELAKQQRILKTYLEQYAKYCTGDSVRIPYDQDIWTVTSRHITASGAITYRLRRFKGTPYYSRLMRESILSPV